MLTSTLQLSRRFVRRMGPLYSCGRALGINQFLRKVHNSNVLRRGIYSTTMMGARLDFAVSTLSEIRRIETLHYEEHFVAKMTDTLQPNDVVFDIGANIGVVSLLLAKGRPGQCVRVHSFEPEPANAAKLRRNIELNNESGAVTVHPFALGAAAGKFTLFVSGEAGTGTHSLLEGTSAGKTPIEIDVCTCDEFLRQQQLVPTVVKIDVEGAEGDVLKGMDQTLRSGSIRELFIELHPVPLATQNLSAADLTNWLSERGYSLAWSTDRNDELHHHYRRTA